MSEGCFTLLEQKFPVFCGEFFKLHVMFCIVCGTLGIMFFNYHYHVTCITADCTGCLYVAVHVLSRASLHWY